MPIYNVYVICDQCGQPHSVNVKLDLADETLDKTRLVDYYGDRPVPSEIAFMQTNKYRCPHTKQLFPANDLNQAVLFASV
jgi:hypothetical protein